MVRITNNLAVATNIIKINLYEIGTLEPGQSIDISIEKETIEIRLEKTT